MRVYTIKVLNGAVYELSAVGDYVRVRSSPVDLIIENPDDGENIEVSQGDDFQFSPFQRLRISHAAGTEQTIKLVISTGKKAGASQVSGSLQIVGQQGAFVHAQKTVTNASAQMLAAKTNRRYLLVQNNDAAGDIWIRLDGTAATAATGIKIPAGGSYECQGYAPTGAIMAIGSIASNANIVTVEG